MPAKAVIQVVLPGSRGRGNGARPGPRVILAWGAVLRILRAVKTGGCADKEDV